MNLNKNIYLVLFTISFLILCAYSYISLDLLINAGDHIEMNISSVFGNILMCSFFLSGYIILLKEKASKKHLSRLKSFILFLLILSVIWLCIYNFTLLEEGFKSGKELYWQITALIFGFTSIGFNFYLLNFRLKNI